MADALYTAEDGAYQSHRLHTGSVQVLMRLLEEVPVNSRAAHGRHPQGRARGRPLPAYQGPQQHHHQQFRPHHQQQYPQHHQQQQHYQQQQQMPDQQHYHRYGGGRPHQGYEADRGGQREDGESRAGLGSHPSGTAVHSAPDGESRPGLGASTERSAMEVDGVGATAPSKATVMAANYLQKHGHSDGSGLGRNQQGITAPIQPKAQTTTTGLGFQAAPAEDTPIRPRQHEVDIHQAVPHEQHPTFLPRREKLVVDSNFSFENFYSITEEAEPYDYNIFCTQEIVKSLWKSKDKLGYVSKNDFLHARRKANPYESIRRCVLPRNSSADLEHGFFVDRSSIFMNRAAVKMANLDQMYNLLHNKDGEPFYFCDVCAGPGGFTEYVFWRKFWKQQEVHGWGFTLKGMDDWRFDKFNPDAPHHTFHALYGVDGTGDIYKSANIKDFVRQVMEATKGAGVHLFTADGGFSVEGQENMQEVLVKRLVLCQFLCGLACLGRGGNFLCKIFDVFTPFTAGLIYLLYHQFEHVSIVAPYTSRPANSERYVVCKNLLVCNQKLVEYLFQVNELFETLPKGKDVRHVVPFEWMSQDTAFMQYMRDQGIAHATKQIDALELLVKYVEDPMLLPVNQADVKQRCYNHWNIPDPNRYQMRNRQPQRFGRGPPPRHRDSSALVGQKRGAREYNDLPPATRQKTSGEYDEERRSSRGPRPRGHTPRRPVDVTSPQFQAALKKYAVNKQ